jgi:tetratricopeptide (TPR) repeat protein
MESKIDQYISSGDPYHDEVQEILSHAEQELKVMKRHERKGDKLLEEGREKDAMDAWRMALRHAGATHQKRIRDKLYELERKVEGGVRNMFDAYVNSARSALEAGEYQTALDEAESAIEVTRNNPDITLDAGLAHRYKRLAEENIKEQEKAAAAARAERERQAAIRAYIKKHGKPMTPTVIDYSEEDKITAVGEGEVKKGDRDRWYANALIDKDAFRKLYIRVPEGFDVIVSRSHDEQDRDDDIVTRTFLDEGFIYFIVDNIEGGRFYTVVMNPEGLDPEYTVEATLYHELDK